MRDYHQPKMRQNYRRDEKRLFKIYVILCFFIFTLLAASPFYFKHPWICYIIGDFIEGSLLTLSFGYLMHKMRNYHKKQYDQNKWSMVLFFVLEIHLYFYWYALPAIFRCLSFLNTDTNWDAYRHEFEYGVLYLIQASSILYVKPSKDLLEGISRLDYLNLVSVFQI